MRYVFIVIAAMLAALVSADITISIYNIFVPVHGGTFLDLAVPAIGLPLGLAVFLPALTLIFGSDSRYRALKYGVSILLVAEIILDLKHFYVPIIFIAAGVIVGLLLRFLAANIFGKMSAFEPYKKYF